MAVGIPSIREVHPMPSTGQYKARALKLFSNSTISTLSTSPTYSTAPSELVVQPSLSPSAQMARVLSTILFFIFFFAMTVTSTRVTPVNRLAEKSVQDIYVPRIIKPDSNTIWVGGIIATVTWDASDAPPFISNEASVYLHGYGVVITGFDLRSGSVSFPVPNVAPGQYYITLFGDSGNYSPVFSVF